MCVVEENYESIPGFPDLLRPYDVRDLYLGLFRPDDIGEATHEEVLARIPRYSDLGAPLEKLVRDFVQAPVSIGNLPQCIAPRLAPYIGHGGPPTDLNLVRFDGRAGYMASLHKYEFAVQGRVKPDRCRSCVFDARCEGVPWQYAEKFGFDELQPVTAERLAALGLPSRDVRRSDLALPQDAKDKLLAMLSVGGGVAQNLALRMLPNEPGHWLVEATVRLADGAVLLEVFPAASPRKAFFRTNRLGFAYRRLGTEDPFTWPTTPPYFKMLRERMKQEDGAMPSDALRLAIDALDSACRATP